MIGDIPPDVTISELIDRAHEDRENSKPRTRFHLGASYAGHHCDRFVWLSWRWAFKDKFSGRMLRLFRRGHNEEGTALDDLRAIGCTVHSQQLKAEFGGHLAGSIDGILDGLPGAEKTPHLFECKTYNTSDFNALVKSGSVRGHKPQHYAQMQLYMGLARS